MKGHEFCGSLAYFRATATCTSNVRVHSLEIHIFWWSSLGDHLCEGQDHLAKPRGFIIEQRGWPLLDFEAHAL